MSSSQSINLNMPSESLSWSMGLFSFLKEKKEAIRFITANESRRRNIEKELSEKMAIEWQILTIIDKIVNPTRDVKNSESIIKDD